MKKKLVLISMIAVCVVLGVLCYKAWLIAFVATKFLSGRTEGRQGIVRSIIIPWRSYRLHLHHWLLALMVGGVFAFRGIYIVTPEVFLGVFSAAIFQGIYCYGDWHRIIMKKGQAARSQALAAVNSALSPASMEGGHVPAPGAESPQECCAQATH